MGVQVPELNSCLCTSLRTGSLVIFWFSVIHGIILMCSPPIFGGYRISSVTTVMGNTTNTIYLAPNEEKFEWTLFQLMNDYRYYPELGWLTVIFGAVEVLSSTLALVGTYKNLFQHLKPFLLWHLLIIVLLFIECILYLIMTVMGNFTYFRQAVFVAFLSALYAFFWVVVFNLYRHLRETASIPRSSGTEYLS